MNIRSQHSGAARAALPQIGAPSADSFPAQRQGGASNGKEERPLHFSIDDGDRIGGNIMPACLTALTLTGRLID